MLLGQYRIKKEQKHNFMLQVVVMTKIEDEYQENKQEDEEEEKPCQISPVFTKDGEISNSEYDLTFLGNF